MVCLAIAIAGLAAPFINAAPFGGRIQRALEISLGRKVSFGAVRFTLFSGPGFSLTDVIIDEDRRFGLEPFAYVPTLRARVRLGALLRGRLALYSLRLEDPSLNVVKQPDGGWNVVELVSRLTPRRLPLDLFPALSVSNARLDFKMGAQKTTFYVARTDLSVYPERSGKLYIQFSGSPARTDRAGSGFGHIRGTANWYRRPVSAEANQLELDVRLDPSNLSELTTLVEGHDVGIHGLLSSHARIEGPIQALRVNGDLELSNIRRWDLLPAAGEEWQIGYQGAIDLARGSLTLQTVSSASQTPAPVTLQLRATQLSSKPSWSMLAALQNAPAAELLPVSRRMGLPLPEDLQLTGTVSGAVSYSAAGFAGGIQLQEASLKLPNLPTLRAQSLVATISPQSVRLDPVQVDTGAPGTLEVGGDYKAADAGGEKIGTSVHLRAVDFPVETLRKTLAAWVSVPPAMDLLHRGRITGQIDFYDSDTSDPLWAAQLSFSDAEVRAAGLGEPLRDAKGMLRLNGDAIDVERFSAVLGGTVFTGTYHSALSGAERLRVEADTLDLHNLEAALDPTLRASGFLARLGVSRREIPGWLAGRHLQADVAIHHFLIDGTALGPLKTRLSWAGTHVQIPNLELQLPDGLLRANGALDVATSTPHYEFAASVAGYRWRGGWLTAEGSFQTSGTGVDVLENLRATGTFTGRDVSPSTEDLFERVSGVFDFSFADKWPNLRISRLEASQGEEAWTGSAATQSDGKLVIDLQREGRQRRVISGLEPLGSPLSSTVPGP